MKKVLFFLIVLAALVLPAALAESCPALLNTGEHAWAQTDVAKATCETDGYYVLRCTSCGLTQKVTTEHAFGHNYVETGDWTDSTCFTHGWHTMRCVNCGDEKSFALPLTEHSWVNTGAGQVATCQTPGWRQEECSLCGAERTVTLPVKDHIWKVTGNGVPSTCVEQGFSEQECTQCGQIRTILLPLENHSYGPWTISVPATDHSMGTRSRACTVCGGTETATYYPDGTVYRGCPNGSDVMDVQRMLVDLGVLNDKADGVFGAKTEAAVTQFQNYYGLTADGIAWPQTIDLLTSVWQYTMGVAAENQGGGPEDDAPGYCVFWAEDIVMDFVTCCGQHAYLVEREAELNRTGVTGGDLYDLEADWKRELDALYDAWLERCASADQVTAVRSAQNSFYASVDAQETAFGAYSNDLRLMALRAECVRLCAMLNAVNE